MNPNSERLRTSLAQPVLDGGDTMYPPPPSTELPPSSAAAPPVAPGGEVFVKILDPDAISVTVDDTVDGGVKAKVLGYWVVFKIPDIPGSVSAGDIMPVSVRYWCPGVGGVQKTAPFYAKRAWSEAVPVEVYAAPLPTELPPDGKVVPPVVEEGQAVCAEIADPAAVSVRVAEAQAELVRCWAVFEVPRRATVQPITAVVRYRNIDGGEITRGYGHAQAA